LHTTFSFSAEVESGAVVGAVAVGGFRFLPLAPPAALPPPPSNERRVWQTPQAMQMKLEV